MMPYDNLTYPMSDVERVAKGAIVEDTTD